MDQAPINYDKNSKSPWMFSLRFVGNKESNLAGNFRKVQSTISPELYEKLSLKAEAQGKSLNMLAQESLQRSVAI